MNNIYINNLQQVADNLKKKGYSNDEINVEIQELMAVYGCDSECQKQKEIKKFKENLVKQKKFVNNEENIKKAEKKLLTFQHGSQYYKEFMKEKVSKEFNEFKNKLLRENQKYNSNFNTKLNYYKNQINHYDNTSVLINMKIDEKVKLEKQLEQYNKTVETNNRKSYYEIQQTDYLFTIRKVILFCFYLLLVIYFVKGPFFKNKQYKNYKVIAIIMLYILFPYVVNYFVLFLRFSYNFIRRNVGKNVYNNI